MDGDGLPIILYLISNSIMSQTKNIEAKQEHSAMESQRWSPGSSNGENIILFF